MTCAMACCASQANAAALRAMPLHCSASLFIAMGCLIGNAVIVQCQPQRQTERRWRAQSRWRDTG
ncbi:hypothetical protein Xlen_07980 [Xanthomonas campestris pv. leeana]|nr:hypothetical protein Xlen_07980 [Xanthomonas campestris pv. leeana]